jgi:phosphate:Na+ symporter
MGDEMTIFNVLSLIGGLALFLFGMNYMGASLEKLGGGKFESILEKMTNSRIKGVLLGAGVTALIQSSSAVTVMAVGFVNSKIMSLHQVVGIIMGANIGTTITSWLLSLTGIESSNLFVSLLKPSSFTPMLALIGIILYAFCKGDKKKNIGSILLGFAILIFGMESMSSAVAPLRSVPEFTSLLTKFSNPVLGVLAGAVLTAVIQSSSASVGILQALAVTGSITVSSAFPIVLGQNIGTCVTAMISSIGTNKNAKRTAVVHLAFNSLGVILAMIVFYGLNFVVGLPFFENSVNGADIAIIHTLFNLLTTVVLFPFGKQLEKLACFFVKDDDVNNASTLVEERFLMSPAYAIDKVKERCDEMGALAKENIALSLDFIKTYSHTKDEKISTNEKKLDAFEDELETYLVQIGSMDTSVNDSLQISKLTHAISIFERIGDYGANILKTKRRMHKDNIHFTIQANHELEIMGKAVNEIVDKAVHSFCENDIELAVTIEPLEQVIDKLKYELRARHSKRIESGECTIENGMLFFDIINSFERIADHCSNLAVCMIELSHGSYQTHSYLKNAKDKAYMQQFNDYLDKYKI